MTSHTNTAQQTQLQAEPLLASSDLDEFRDGLDNFTSGRWHEDRWKTFRLRFGIYEQRQKGQHMVRLKLPGGRLSVAQACAIAAATREHTGGSIHITTRQAIQLYFVELDKLTGLLEALNAGDVTTRESSGGTFRNITACAGCEKAYVDAASVADGLTRAWLRHPLTQHMPRKVKAAVSGCDTDCGLSKIDDLGFIAVERGGKFGFRVVAGGGLGTHPRRAVDVIDFVTEHKLPAVQEAVARVHHRHSKREDKNRSRIKFLVDRFGAEEFARLISDEFAKIKDLPRRPWQDVVLQSPEAANTDVPVLLGPQSQPDGRISIGIDVPLGDVSPEQLEGIALATEQAGGSDFTLTRNQNIIATGLAADNQASFIEQVQGFGLDASGREHELADFVACYGSSTCAIGITDANALANEVLDAYGSFVGLPKLRIRISGCHNSCGHHHIADIGFHGVAKKIAGKPAPHYQLHLGGSQDQHGLTGPAIPAKRVKAALLAVLKAYADGRQGDESVRAWTERLGKTDIAAILAPVLEVSAKQQAENVFDIGDERTFVPPETSTGECAAGSVVAEYLDDLARVSLENAGRALAVNKPDDAASYLALAVHLPARRLLNIAGEADGGTPDEVFAKVKTVWSHNSELIATYHKARKAQHSFADDARLSAAGPVIAAWLELADTEVERLLADIPGFLQAGAAQ